MKIVIISGLLILGATKLTIAANLSEETCKQQVQASLVAITTIEEKTRNVSMTLRHVPCEFREAFIRSQPSWVD